MRMKKWMYVLAAAGMMACACVGCGKKSVDGGEPVKAIKSVNTDDATIKGMYLTFGEDEDSYIFADIENDSLFFAEIPEDNLLDETGEKMKAADLQKGDIVAVYNSGIVAESFPPQYPGVTKMVRVEKGTAEDAAKYDTLIAQIYRAPHPSQIPYLDIENRQETAIVTSMINHGGYSWSYKDADGKQQAETADSLHVLDWERNDAGLVELICDTTDKDLKLMFSKKPESVTVTRWDSTATVADIESGETVEVTLNGKEAVLQDAKTGSVYEVIATWENGRVTYGFAVK